MARGIMANKEENVVSPTSDQTESKHQNPVQPLTDAAAPATCSCTKISTMQLFYEMKQKFPTVPDNVVCEFVGQNCHNRSACIDSLEDYPNSANMYPQALRNQPMKKKVPLNRTASNAISDAKIDLPKENLDGNQLSISTELKPQQHPNTLNLTNLSCCGRPVNRPTRQAPPPPIASCTTTIAPQCKTSQPLNLSVNVIVSPISRPPKSKQSLSHYSFTLHQPKGKTGKDTNHVTNSQPDCVLTTSNDSAPSLIYKSNAFDAEIGYQSCLEITVAGANAKATNESGQQTEGDGDGNSMHSCDISGENNLPSVVASSEFIEETETVHHQVLCKQKLILELDKDRKRLERIQRELQAIQAPLPDGGLHTLTLEIEQLRNDCKLMAQYVEEAGPSYALGETNEAFYRNIYTGQQLPMLQRQPLRPHRPAPTPDFHRTPNRSNDHANVTGVDARFISTAAITQSLNQQFSESNEDGWVCDLCTFQNKYTQRTCEACAMPFLSAGNQMGYNNGFVLPYPLPLNNNNNMPYLYYQAPSMPSIPPQYYPLANPQYMQSRF